MLLAITAFCQRLLVLAETRPTARQWETATSLSAPISAVTKVFSHGDSGTLFSKKQPVFEEIAHPPSGLAIATVWSAPERIAVDLRVVEALEEIKCGSF